MENKNEKTEREMLISLKADLEAEKTSLSKRISNLITKSGQRPMNEEESSELDKIVDRMCAISRELEKIELQNVQEINEQQIP